MLKYESEVIKECMFWAQYTGKIKPGAKCNYLRFKYIVYAACKFIFLWMTEERKWNQSTLDNLNGKIIALYYTENQKKALKGWFDNNHKCKTLSNGVGSEHAFPWGRVALYSFKKLFYVYAEMQKSGKIDNYLPWIEDFARYEAGKIIFTELFARSKPKIIIFSNDHSGFSRAMIKICKVHDVKLIYTQHASIGRGFPCLNYDVCLLDGLVALNQYIDSGPVNGLVVITGRVRPSCIAENKNVVKNIGIATNTLDKLEEWEDVFKGLQNECWELFIRCHPADRRKKKWRELASKYNAVIVSGELSTYLESVDVLVTGLSGVVVDARIMGVPVIMMRSASMMFDLDYYGYIQYEMAVECSDPKALKNCIDEIEKNKGKINNALYYEAGLTCDPYAIKEKILTEYENYLDGNVTEFPGDDFVTFKHRGVLVSCTRKYKEAIEAINQQDKIRSLNLINNPKKIFQCEY